MTRKEIIELSDILHKRHAWCAKEGDKHTIEMIAGDIYTQLVRKHSSAFSRRAFLAAVRDGVPPAPVLAAR